MGTKPEPLIKTKDLRFRYPGTEQIVLDGIDLEINKGEFIAFVGQNGAGKTTLVKHFNGLLLPTDGSVQIDGKDTKELSVEETAHIVGYCYQNPDHQIFSSTVQAEVAFGPKNIGMEKAELEIAVDRALDLVGLLDMKDRYPLMLGRGERQKLAVASVLAMNSPVLIVDEPTTGMDVRGSRSIMKLLKEWHKAGQTILVVTHDMNIVAEFVPTMIVMAGGKILAKKPTREAMLDEKLLEQAYLRPPQVTRMARKLIDYGVRQDILTVREMIDELVKAMA